MTGKTMASSMEVNYMILNRDGYPSILPPSFIPGWLLNSDGPSPPRWQQELRMSFSPLMVTRHLPFEHSLATTAGARLDVVMQDKYERVRGAGFRTGPSLRIRGYLI